MKERGPENAFLLRPAKSRHSLISATTGFALEAFF
jgi:hypothetical protein